MTEGYPNFPDTNRTIAEKAELLALDVSAPRALTTETPTSRRGLATLVASVSSGHGAVWVRVDAAAPPAPGRLEELARTERAHLT